MQTIQYKKKTLTLLYQWNTKSVRASWFCYLYIGQTWGRFVTSVSWAKLNFACVWTSFGIALPDGYGMHWVDGTKNIHNLDETGN